MLFIDQQNTTPVQFSRKSSSRPDSVSAPHTPSPPPPSAPVPRGASAPGRRRLRGPQRQGRGGRRPARRRASLVALCTKQMPREAQHAEMKQSQTVAGNARHRDTRVELIQLRRNDPPAAAALPLPAEDIRHRTAAVLTRVPGLRTACTRKTSRDEPTEHESVEKKFANLQRMSRASRDQSRERCGCPYRRRPAGWARGGPAPASDPRGPRAPLATPPCYACAGPQQKRALSLLKPRHSTFSFPRLKGKACQDDFDHRLKVTVIMTGLGTHHPGYSLRAACCAGVGRFRTAASCTPPSFHDGL